MDRDSGIGSDPTWKLNWNRRHNFELESESELESTPSQKCSHLDVAWKIEKVAIHS